VKYAFILQHRQEFSVKVMCRIFEVSRSGFYDWTRRDKSLSPRAQRQTELDQEVAKAFQVRKGRSGSPEITLDLKDLGIHYNRKTIAKSMQNQGLRAKAARKFKATTNSNHSLPVAENVLNRDFTANAANQKWASDITYLWTEEGWLYLAVIIDLYSRMVVGWSMSERMTTSLIKDALIMAVGRRKMPRISNPVKAIGIDLQHESKRKLLG
jgi:putative transposase